jgi:protein O-GlcNAc transferase
MSARELFKSGVRSRQQGDVAAARGYFEAAIQLQPDFIPAYNNLANLLQAAGDIATAIEIYERGLQIAPDLAVLHCNLASLWQIQGEHDRAIAGFQQAISLKPDFLVAYHNLGKLLAAQGEFTTAIAAYQNALRLNPQAGDVYLDLGHLYRQIGGIREQTIECYRKAAGYLPQSAEAYNSLGAALWMWGEVREIPASKALATSDFVKIAQAAYQRAIALDPNYDAPHFNLGQLLEATGQLTAAQDCYQRALDLQPQATNYLYYLYPLRLKLADWDNYTERLAELIASTQTYLDRSPQTGLWPLTLAPVPVPLDLQRRVAEHYAECEATMVKGLRPQLPPSTNDRRRDRVRIGYVSPDFRNHVVGTLIAEMFQYHQRPEFEIFAYSLVPVVDDITTKIQQGCDFFINMSERSTLEIATQIRTDGIDILIDLAGYTKNTRPGIFALQPAPIQMQ